MNVRDWVQILASVGHLMLAVLCLVRGGRSALARPLALLCLALFGWNFATLAHHLTGAPLWNWLDAIFTALSPPLVFHLIVAFVGMRRVHQRLVQAAYVAFGAFALVSSTAFIAPWARTWIDSPAWATLFLVGWAPLLVSGLLLLVRHLIRSTDVDEKARTRTMLAAVAVGGALASTDLLAGARFAVPHLGSLGTLIGAFLLASAVFRLRLFDRDLSVNTAVYAGALAVTSIAAYAAILVLFGGNVAAVTFGTAAVTIVIIAAVRELMGSLSAHRERVARLAALGRISAQMAHDLKNPLAALLGAAQVLEGELTRAQQQEFLKLVVEQAQRIRTLVEKYERLGRVEPILSRVHINDVVERVVAAQRSIAHDGCEIRMDLARPLPECDADPDLIAGMLENLLRNAIEAMPRGGSLCVRTSTESNVSGGLVVVVSVADTGEGIEARRAERVFDDFFTTKTTGSGFGLAFVKRVALAHGGSVSLTSQPHQGTTVSVRLPVDDGASG